MLPAFLRNLWLNRNHKPFARHHTDLDAFRGAVVAMWAGIESGIDQANHLAWFSTNRKVSNVVPQNFRRKVALFKKLHRDLPLFAPLADDAGHLIAKLEARLQDRHFLVHGYPSPDETDLDGWTLHRHEFRKDGGLNTLKKRFSRVELDGIRREMLDLLNECAWYLNALNDEADKQQPDEVAGSVAPSRLSSSRRRPTPE